MVGGRKWEVEGGRYTAKGSVGTQKLEKSGPQNSGIFSLIELSDVIGFKFRLTLPGIQHQVYSIEYRVSSIEYPVR